MTVLKYSLKNSTPLLLMGRALILSYIYVNNDDSKKKMGVDKSVFYQADSDHFYNVLLGSPKNNSIKKILEDKCRSTRITEMSGSL